MIAISSYRNSLKTKKQEYCFRSVTDQTLDSEQLIKEIIGYNSTITEADARAVLSVLNDRVRHFVKLGYNVELPFAYVHLKANGTTDSVNEGFTPGIGNHRFEVTCIFKNDAARDMEDTSAWRIADAGWVILPKITELVGMTNNGMETHLLDFEGMDIIRIKGKNLSFDASDDAQGVFFVDASGNTVRASRYHNIGTAITDAYIPKTLAAGQYRVKIVTSPRKKCLEECIYASAIKVVA